MKLDSIEARISRRAAVYVFVFGVVVALVQISFLQQSLQSQFDKNKNIWVDSFPENILPHLIDSDHFSVQSKVQLLQSTDLFSAFRVEDGQGNLISEFGEGLQHTTNATIVDNAGVEWGSFAYTPNTSVIRQQIILYSAASLVVLIVLTFTIYFFLRRVLRREFHRFETLLVSLQGLGERIRASTEARKELGIVTALQPAANESSDERRIREVVDGLTDAIQAYNQRVKAAQAELLHSRTQRARAEAIAKTAQMLAHDVRHPFQTLDAGLSLLDSDKIDPEMIKTIRSDVKKSLAEVNGLVADVMEIDKTAKPTMSPVSMTTIVNECISSFRNLGVTNPISTDYQHTHEVLGDQTRLGRVVTNLLSNAIDASEGGEIAIATASHDGQFRLAVHNYGKWIPSDELPHIFDSFYTSGKAEGTGLGLAIVQKIIRDHGGSVQCDSDSSRGTIFTVTLAQSGRRETVETPIPVSSNGLIILVEDNLFLRQAFLSQAASDRAKGFASPEEFWHWHISHPETDIAMIVTDYEFGTESKQTGEDFARELQAKVANVPVYLFSNHATDVIDTSLFADILKKDIDVLLERAKSREQV